MGQGFHKVTVLLSAEDYATVERWSTKEGRTLSETIRRRIRGEPVESSPVQVATAPAIETAKQKRGFFADIAPPAATPTPSREDVYRVYAYAKMAKQEEPLPFQVWLTSDDGP